MFSTDCQCKVDFNLSLTSFDPLIRGVTNLAQFSSQTKANEPVIFISSSASVQNWKSPKGEPVPERSLTDLSLCRSGYGQSKSAASLVLEYAARTWNASSSAIRIGQISGPVNRGNTGSWPESEWIPTMLASSKYLGILPQTLGCANKIDWVPVDFVSNIIHRLGKVPPRINANQKASVAYFHIANPHTVN